MTTPDPQHVFISYSTKDVHFVERLRAKLRDASIPYWIDKEGLQPGTRNWEKAIRSAIQNSFMVILVASPNSVESDYVADEIEIARNIHQRIIVPVWADGDHWNACVPLGMGKMQYVDLRGDSFDTNISHLLQAIDAQRGANGDLAESVFLGLDAEAQARFGHVFFRLFALDEQDRPISLRTPKSYFPDDEPTQQFIQSFTTAKVLVETQVNEEVVLEVAHEALLRNWDRLAEWIAQTTENKRLLQKLEVDAAYWASRGKPRELYRYTFEQEQEIKAICALWEITLNGTLREFLSPQIDRWLEDLGDSGDSSLKRRLAEQEFHRLGKQVQPALISALSHKNPVLRANVAQLMGSTGDISFVPALLTAITDPVGLVRSSAADALGGLHDERAIDALIAALVDNETRVKISAIIALGGGIRDPRAVDPLIVLLSDLDANVRSMATKALSNLRDSRTIDAFITCLADPEPNVRRYASQALGLLGEVRAIEPLTKLIEDETEEVRWAALDSIEQLRRVTLRGENEL